MDAAVIGHTRSICPECLKKIDAEIIAEENNAFVVRTCEEHGKKKYLVSRNAEDYAYFRDCYLYLKQHVDMHPGKQKAYNIHVTDTCNLKCPICYSRGVSKQKDITIADLETHFSGMRNRRLCLFGGEPTLHANVADIIRWIKESGNIAVLYTNGIKLQDAAFVSEIKAAGIDEVHIQFDGFSESAYESFRGNRLLLDQKLKAIDECALQQLTIVLEVTVDSNNVHEVGDMLNFALKNKQVKGIVFRTLCLVDLQSSHENKVTTDDIIAVLSENEPCPITEKEINLFQRLLYKYFYWLRVPLFGCMLNRYYLLCREKDAVFRVSDILNLERLNALLPDFHNKPSRFLQFVWGGIRALPLFSGKTALKVIGLILQNFFLEKVVSFHKHIRPVQSFFFLEISGPMDQYNYDQDIIDLCPSGVYLEGKIHRSLGLAYYDRRMEAHQQVKV